MWSYQNNQEFEIPENAIGYIYLITNLLSNRIYIGRKMLSSNRKVRLTKKEKLLPENKRKTFKRVVKETDWKLYWGSSDDLKTDIKLLGEENFKREILLFTTNKTDTSFYEMYFQIKEDVLFIDSYNKHIANTKFYKGKITNEIKTNFK
jgi:Zn-dependent peptidase ImmA (M78 family)